MAVRILYTKYARSHDKVKLAHASNARLSIPDADEEEKGVDEKTEFVTSTTDSNVIGIFPQYIAKVNITLTIREVGVPHFSDSFTVSAKGIEIFNVHRERPRIGWRQHVVDAKTNEPIMTIRRNIGQLPVSYRCEDPTGSKIMEVQGEFFVPFTGAKSLAIFMNQGESMALDVQGSYRNRHAEIKNKATGEVYVQVKSDVLEARNVIGGRRTYEVSVREGFDLAVATALILAVDARAD